MTPYTLKFPDYLDGYEFEIEAKGYLVEVVIATDNKSYELTVYDPIRLAQEISDELSLIGYCAMTNVIVVPAVTRLEISKAIEKLSTTNFQGLCPCDQKGTLPRASA